MPVPDLFPSEISPGTNAIARWDTLWSNTASCLGILTDTDSNSEFQPHGEIIWSSDSDDTDLEDVNQTLKSKDAGSATSFRRLVRAQRKYYEPFRYIPSSTVL